MRLLFLQVLEKDLDKTSLQPGSFLFTADTGRMFLTYQMGEKNSLS